MNCQYCGAPMTLFRERDYFYCEHCGSFHFPSPSPDGVRVLGEAPEAIGCPVCGVPLLLATLDDRYRGYQCGTCQGVLLHRSSFRQAVRSRRARARGLPDPPHPLNREELDRRLACPRCAHEMSTHPYYGPGNIVIDTCDRCDIIWLDYGELGRAVHAPGRDWGAVDQPAEEGPDEGHEQDKPHKYRIALAELLSRFF